MAMLISSEIEKCAKRKKWQDRILIYFWIDIFDLYLKHPLAISRKSNRSDKPFKGDRYTILILHLWRCEWLHFLYRFNNSDLESIVMAALLWNKITIKISSVKLKSLTNLLTQTSHNEYWSSRLFLQKDCEKNFWSYGTFYNCC